MDREAGNPAPPEASEDRFLRLLAKDIEADPGSLVPITEERMVRARRLTAGIVVDLDEKLKGEVDL